jgi:TRAP-type uncharacterized transport system substrate-binding protein
MSRFNLTRPLKWVASGLCLLGVVSLILSYFIPAPPTSVTIGTAFKGASFEYYGRLYRDEFARANVKLELRETNGAVENLRLLQDPDSGVQIGFVTGGVSDGEHSPGLLSLGTIDYLPIWIFYVSAEPFDRLSQLKGKRIAVGPEGSGTRFTAEKILGKAGVTSENTMLSPLAGNGAAEALADNKVDVVWILGAPDVPAVRSLLQNPHVRLLNFPMAEAFTRIFPNLIRLVLPEGVIDIDGNVPPTDVQLIATSNRVLVRSDLHPAIVNLLLETMVAVHGGAGIFQKAGDFPRSTDSDYPVSASAVDFYKNGPSFLEKYFPLWLVVHAKRALAVFVAAIAVGLPLLHYLPLLYKWSMRRRILYWYGQLKSLEDFINANPGGKNLIEQQTEVERIEAAVSRTRFPLAFTDQLYDLRGHIDLVRRRLAPPANTPERVAAE